MDEKHSDWWITEVEKPASELHLYSYIYIYICICMSIHIDFGFTCQVAMHLHT